MDVEFLSGMISELMLDHDSLSLPGLGTFVAEQMPASFSDRGYTINPPYRRLSFTGKVSDDTLLLDLYKGANPQAPEEAVTVLNQFLQNLKNELVQQKSVDLPGLGRLRATRENHFFFVADETLDISPDACGLTAVSLKTHSAPARALPDFGDLVTTTANGRKTAENVSEREEKPANGRKSAENVSVFAGKTGASVTRPFPKPLRWTIGIVSVALVLLLAFFILSRVAPDFTDKLLYSPEELEILNYPEDGLGLPG